MTKDRVISREEFETGTKLPTDGEKLKRSVDTMRASMPVFIESAKLTATMTRAKYEALIDEGFTPAQALELCKGK